MELLVVEPLLLEVFVVDDEADDLELVDAADFDEEALDAEVEDAEDDVDDVDDAEVESALSVLALVVTATWL